MIKIGLYIDEQTWRDFRVECVRRRLSSSQEVARLIREQLALWEAEKKDENGAGHRKG